MIFAHSRKKQEDGPWQLLEDHAFSVANRAAGFVPLGFASMAYIAGMWHDCGKYQPEFQRYLCADTEASNEDRVRGVPHSIVGAALALEQLGFTDASLVLSTIIAAHHGALKRPDQVDSYVRATGKALLDRARDGGLSAELAALRPLVAPAISALAVRMIFSALIDADLLDTEAWDRGKERQRDFGTMTELRDRLDIVCRRKIVAAELAATTAAERALAMLRRSVYEACVRAGDDATEPQPPQWTMTAPTGGGKTLSGLAFALHHAARTGRQRVIVVVPYTSILEQTADIYREALGAENVVEHHSNLSSQRDTDRNRQACENWDAPVVVTTSVQFFESLHAASKRPCRKLHRIANSVVLLDEVQTFPAGLLRPIHRVLEDLSRTWRTTIVHGTATQPLLAVPPLASLSRSTQGVPALSAREMMPDVPGLFAAVQSRFRLEAPWGVNEPLAPSTLSDDVRKQASALVITHRRDDARQLAELLGPSCLHLSAAMCAAHRNDVLTEVRRRLDAGEPCRLVATQLVEAGVDIDFPVVYRALAGFETLAQAAGRCNRAMRLPEGGRFVVYLAGSTPGLDDEGEEASVKLSKPPRGTPLLGMQVAAVEWKQRGAPNLNDPALFPRFSRKVLSKRDADANAICECEERLDFPEVAASFRMIEETMHSVVVPYGDGAVHLQRLQQEKPSRELYRALQRYVVGVRLQVLEELERSGWLEPALPGDASGGDTLWALRDVEKSPYSKRFGLVTAASQLTLASLQV